MLLFAAAAVVRIADDNSAIAYETSIKTMINLANAPEEPMVSVYSNIILNIIRQVYA
jgi:hypothetical protein